MTSCCTSIPEPRGRIKHPSVKISSTSSSGDDVHRSPGLGVDSVLYTHFISTRVGRVVITYTAVLGHAQEVAVVAAVDAVAHDFDHFLPSHRSVGRY